MNTDHQEYREVTYLENSIEVLNPHRGWSLYTKTQTSSYKSLKVPVLERFRKTSPQPLSVVFRQFVLDSYTTKPLDSEVLNLIHEDFSVVRKAGWTILPRFCYTLDRKGPPYHDANKEVVLNHIQSLGPVLSQHADVIVAVQAGFIGVWGEWYYTTYFGDKGVISESQWRDRKEVVDALLKALPASLSVQLRTPYFKYKFWGDVHHPTTYSDLMQGTDKSRIGHHNDAFLANDRDLGTYRDKEKEYPYLTADTMYTPMAGETCAVNPPRSDCATATSELSLFHWSVLNKCYKPEVIQSWKDSGCYNKISISLGYRLVLKSAVLPTVVRTNEEMNFKITLINTGYAAPLKDMDVTLVFKPLMEIRSVISISVPNIDVRVWHPGPNHVISGPINISSLPAGSYQVYLAVRNRLNPDDEHYFIIFANDDVPDDASRLNNLHHSIQVIDTLEQQMPQQRTEHEQHL